MSSDTLAPAASALAQASARASAEEVAAHVILEVVLILAATRVTTWLVRRFLGQTDAVGDILAGILIGPSLVGALWPDFFHSIFHPAATPVFAGIAQVGVLLFVFQIGLEFRFSHHLSGGGRRLLVMSSAGILVPFALGFLASGFFWRTLPEPRPSLLAFQLFVGTAMSVTALPVLGRILLELGLSRTRIAAMAVGAAAVDDVAAWLLLAAVVAIVRADFEPATFARSILGMGAFVALMFGLVSKLARRFMARPAVREAPASALPFVLIAVFASSLLTASLGVNGIIGAFILGVALHREEAFVAEWRTRVSGLVNALFLPVFFTYTGLRTDLSALRDGSSWLQLGAICVIAFAGKLGGVYLASRTLGERPRSAAALAVCMNARGLTELVVLNVGRDLGLLSPRLFTMFVTMALVSTFAAAPLIRRLVKPSPRLEGASPAPPEPLPESGT